jgi:hypothetical protein
METAIIWPGRYLGHVPQLLRTVQAAALARVRDRDIAHARAQARASGSARAAMEPKASI